MNLPKYDREALSIVTDNHSLTFKVDKIVTKEQMHHAIDAMMKEYASSGHQPKTYLLSFVRNEAKENTRCYAWFESTEIYHLLMGKTSEGKERIKQYPDPNWTTPDNYYCQDPFDENRPKKSWADIMEEEEALICPIITENLPPLLVIPSIELTPQQRELHPSHQHFVSIDELNAVHAHNVRAGLQHNVLKSNQLAPGMDANFIRGLFTRFSTSKRMVTFRKGERPVPYPLVKVYSYNNNPYAQVTFDPLTQDASFAFQLMCKREFENGNKKTELRFSYDRISTRNKY